MNLQKCNNQFLDNTWRVIYSVHNDLKCGWTTNEPHHENLFMWTTMAQISRCISTFVVRCLDNISCFYIGNFMPLAKMSRVVWVLPGRKPRRQVFSWRSSFLKRVAHLWEISQYFWHFISSFSTADIHNDITVRVLWQGLGDHSLTTTERSWYSRGTTLDTTVMIRNTFSSEWTKFQIWMGAKWLLHPAIRSAWASIQSDKSSLCLLWVAKAQTFFMWIAKTLIRLGACPGWSEYSLDAKVILLVFSCFDSYGTYCWPPEKRKKWYHRVLSSLINIRATSLENLFMPYANNKGADQPEHPHSLISTFVVHCLDSIIPLLTISDF